MPSISSCLASISPRRATGIRRQWRPKETETRSTDQHRRFLEVLTVNFIQSAALGLPNDRADDIHNLNFEANLKVVKKVLLAHLSKFKTIEESDARPIAFASPTGRADPAVAIPAAGAATAEIAEQIRAALRGAMSRGDQIAERARRGGV